MTWAQSNFSFLGDISFSGRIMRQGLWSGSWKETRRNHLEPWDLRTKLVTGIHHHGNPFETECEISCVFNTQVCKAPGPRYYWKGDPSKRTWLDKSRGSKVFIQSMKEERSETQGHLQQRLLSPKTKCSHQSFLVISSLAYFSKTFLP